MKRTYLVGAALLLTGMAAAIGWGDPSIVATSEPAAAAATAASAPEPTKRLTAVRQVEFHSHGDWQMISFAECAIFEVPTLKLDAPEAEKAARTKFRNEHKIDGPIWHSEDGENFYIGITTGPGTAMLDVDNTAWETFTPADIEQTLRLPKAQKGGATDSNPHAPVTFVFRTIHGTTGIGQVNEEHDGDRIWAIIKTKILQTAPATTQ